MRLDASNHHRRTRRGRRSFDALVRRASHQLCDDHIIQSFLVSPSDLEPPHSNFPQRDGLRESNPISLFDSREITILHANIRGFLSHRAELEIFIDLLPRPRPAFVALNETFLDISVEAISLSGYTEVRRLDRRDGRQGGGIALFVLDELRDTVSHLEDSPKYERSWSIIHGKTWSSASM